MTAIQKRRNIRLAEALESGEYKQIQKKLKGEGNKFCCLGVACELAKRTVKLSWKDEALKDRLFPGATAVNELPHEKVVKYYGWESEDPIISVAGKFDKASRHNDKLDRTFKQIAKGFRKLAA